MHVAGPWVERRAGLDSAASEVSLAIDGDPVARGRGCDVLGDPVAAVAWLARRLADEGFGLCAGEVVAVGSCTGLVGVRPGQTLLAGLGGHGWASLTLR